MFLDLSKCILYHLSQGPCPCHHSRGGFSWTAELALAFILEEQLHLLSWTLSHHFISGYKSIVFSFTFFHVLEIPLYEFNCHSNLDRLFFLFCCFSVCFPGMFVGFSFTTLQHSQTSLTFLQSYPEHDSHTLSVIAMPTVNIWIQSLTEPALWCWVGERQD